MRLKTLVLCLFLSVLSALPARATISTLQSQVVDAGNGATTIFSFPFTGVAASDLSVVYTNSSGQQTTLAPSQYTVTLNPVAPGQLWSVGGFITYPLAGSPIASGTSLTISRILPLKQLTSLVGQGNYSPTLIERPSIPASCRRSRSPPAPARYAGHG